MNELASAPISPWYTVPAAVGLLALTFVFAPGVLLHLGVLIYPMGDERRAQFTADLYDVPFIKRPFWVASTLVRCLFEGVSARRQLIRTRNAKKRSAASQAHDYHRSTLDRLTNVKFHKEKGPDGKVVWTAELIPIHAPRTKD